MILQGNRRRLREARNGFGFVAPTLIMTLVFVVFPVLFSLYMSFQKWSMLEPPQFVGLSNYTTLINDPEFWQILKNTLYYTLSVPIGIVTALPIAILLNRPLAGQGIHRTVFFLPMVTSTIVVSQVFTWLYEPTYGLANHILKTIGIAPQMWLDSPKTAMASIILMSVWQNTGYRAILLLAGLQSIPKEFYEAAEVDGANKWHSFWSITLPMLKPTLFYLIITGLIGSFQVFSSIYAMTRGGPLNSTNTIVYAIYQNAFEFFKMGYACSMAYVLFLITFAITAVQWRYREFFTAD